MLSRVLLLLFGVFACATAVIMIKLSRIEPVLLSAVRLLAAGVVLTPLYGIELRNHRTRFGIGAVKSSIVPGILLGLHFITWVVGARLTLAANSSLIVNMIPVITPLYLIVLAREAPNRRELVGTAIALAGLFVLAGGDFRISAESVRGDFMCFVSMLFFALYLVMARRYRERQQSVWLYVVPLYYAGGFFCLAASVIFERAALPSSSREILLALGLVILPTILGHTILNHSMRTLRGQVVSVTNLCQFVFAGIMGALVLHEFPPPSFYAASLFVVAGALCAITGSRGAQ